MKKLLTLLFSLFVLSSTSVFADDISDFEIEGITIGDSLLDYMSEDEIQEYLNVDALLYQKMDDLVEAVTRKGKHYIDHPCMACLDGNYVANDIDEAKINEMETMRLNDRNGK